MNGHLVTRVKAQFYLDSVALMRMSRTLASGDGIQDAAMMMATPANLAILHSAGLLEADGQHDAGPGDLLIAVRADTPERAETALQEAEAALSQPKPTGTTGGTSTASDTLPSPRSLRRAVELRPDARLALISVPGPFAISEARKAIRSGLHAMIFSDNVPLVDEVTLKQEARALGRLVMGPDCGTAIINGVPLAFANELPRGDIGIIGASGTGIQEVSCLLAMLGRGISHAIGVGGRDLSQAVGGISTLMALALLDADPATQHIVLISKPPAAAVAETILARVGASHKPCTVCFIGGEAPTLPANARWAQTLTAAAETAADAMLTASTSDSLPASSRGQLLRGLFCGGTLCAEAQVICRQAGLTLSSNAAIPGVDGVVSDDGHTLIDLGADEYTQGRPHPMIEPAIRNVPLAAALGDARTGAVLLDLVIGYGSHADPAGQLLASLPDARTIPIFASVTGTDADPQRRSRQLDTLRSAGIHVSASGAHATQRALEALGV